MSQNYIITGAGRGIGRACAVEMASRGCRLVLASRGMDSLKETQALAPESHAIACDMRVQGEIEAMVAESIRRMGHVDGIVHAAGMAPLVPIEGTTRELWDEVIATNLTSAYVLARAIWPHFSARGQGAMVNIATIGVRDPFAGFSAYAASKAGLVALGQVLAREGASKGIRVHTVAPGAVETGMLRAIISEKQVPRDRALTPAAVAKVVADCAIGSMAITSGEVIFVHRP